LSANQLAKLNFARAQYADAAEIAQLVNSAYRGDSSRAGWTTEADLLGGVRTSLEDIQKLISDGNEYLLTLRQASELLGCCAISQYSSTDAYIGMVTVRPNLQGQQLGRQLLEAAEQVAASHFNASYGRMTVISVRHELIARYQRRGYEDTSERNPFPMSDPRFGLPKVSHLEFIVMRKKL